VTVGVELLLSRNRLLLGTFLSVLLCTSLILSVNADAEMWDQTYGDTGQEDAFALVETSDGGYALAGITSWLATSSVAVWLVKTDVHGNMEWNQTYWGTDNYWASSVVEASDGGYALAGFTSPVMEGESDIWLAKTDEFGNMEWNQTYGGELYDAAFSVVEASDGGYVVAGMWNCSPPVWPINHHALFFSTGGDGWLMKTDESGNIEWNITYPGWGYSLTSFFSVVEASDGGYAVAGRNDNANGLLVKVNESGNIDWDITYGTLWASFFSVVEASDGGYAVAGCYNGADDWLLVKTDEFGVVEWNQTYGGAGDDLAFSVVEASDGGYVTAGIWNYYENNLIGYTKYTGSFWIVKTYANGTIEWDHVYGGLGPDDYDWGYSLVATSDGGYAMAGTTHSFGAGGDFWLIKTDEAGFAPVVPEATWVIMPILMIATLAILISKKKLGKRCSEECGGSRDTVD
jgi:hypothetical protein